MNREADKAHVIPLWASRPAPEPLALVQQFVNSHAYSGREDQFGSAAAALGWCRSHGYGATTPTRSQLDLLLVVREALRAALLAHAGHGDLVVTAAVLGDALGRPQLTVEEQDATVVLVGTGRGVARLVNDLAAAWATARLTGTWVRLKACGNDDCRVVFWDHTKNGSGRYCSAAACANRARQRTYRRRHHNE
jgi:predicted RNA-binding Zn ribbon-like protein